MARAIGLDIGSRAVKLVEVDGSPKKFKVTRFLVHEIPGDGGAAEGEVVSETVTAILKEGKAVKDTVVAAMDASSIVIREILVPFLEEDQIRRVLKYEAEAHLHNFAIEDVIVDYVKVGEVRDQSRILVFAAPKDRIRERLAQIGLAGVDPMHVGLDLVALYNASAAAGAFEEHPEAVVLDIGATTTKILFVSDGRLKSARSLRTGSESITRVLAQDLRVDTDSARERVERGDDGGRDDDLLAPLTLPDDDEDLPETGKSAEQLETAIVHQRQDDFLARLHRETARSMASFSGDTEVDAIYLTGGASLASGLRSRLEERFGKPVIRLDFLGNGDHGIPAADHDRANAQIGVALGSALSGVSDELLGVEFRRDDLRYTRKFDLIKVTLACTVSLVFLLLFLYALKTSTDYDRTRRELGYALRYLRSVYLDKTRDAYGSVLEDSAKTLPADTENYHAALPTWMNQLDVMHKHITNELGYDVKDIPPIRSALEIWNDVFEKLEAVRMQLGYLKLTDFDATQKNLKLTGLIGDRSLVDLMVQEISKLDYVTNVESLGTEFDKRSGKIRFVITGDLVPTTAGRRP